MALERPIKAPRSLFKYDDLDPNHGTFRLLRILPKLDGGLIHIEIFEAPLDSTSENTYCALSYEWGPNERPYYWLRLNDGLFRVRKNLNSFLQVEHAKLQFASHSRHHMWIDALCIDQGNLLERGHQVRRMSDIYQSARLVLAWLGPCASKHFDEASGSLQSLSRVAEGVADPTKWEGPGCSTFELFTIEFLAPGSDASSAFLELCDKSYWARLWIVQEIHSAKEAHLLLGCHSLPWHLVKQVLRLRIKITDQAETPYQIALRDDTYSEKSVCRTIHDFRHCICSDFRDRVYAILGLLPDGKHFPVDYSITKEELFCAVMIATCKVAPSAPKAVDLNGSVAQLLSRNRLYRCAMNELSFDIALNVATDLEVSLDTLDRYLVSRSDLGLDILVRCRRITNEVTQLADSSVEYKSRLACAGKDPRTTNLEVILRVHERPFRAGFSQHGTCQIIQEVWYPELFKGAPGLLSCVANMPFDGCHFRAQKLSIWLPFRTAMSLLWMNHTVKHIAKEDLERIAAIGDYGEPTRNKYGRWSRTVILDSILT